MVPFFGADGAILTAPEYARLLAAGLSVVIAQAQGHDLDTLLGGAL